MEYNALGYYGQVRIAVKALDQALERERARHDKALGKGRAALAAAELATATATAAAASAEAGSRIGAGGRSGALPVKEALEQAEALKKQANMILADTRYPEAVEQYTLGIKVSCMLESTLKRRHVPCSSTAAVRVRIITFQDLLLLSMFRRAHRRNMSFGLSIVMWCAHSVVVKQTRASVKC